MKSIFLILTTLFITTPSHGALTKVPLNGLAQSGATTGQVPKWSGSAWIASADNSGSGGANTTLSNLTSPVAINQNLDPSTDGTFAFGGPTKRWLGGSFNELEVGFLNWTGTGRSIDVANKALAWNNSGAFVAGASAIRWNVANEVRFPRLQGALPSNIVIESGNAQDLTFKAPITMAGPVNFVLPPTNGSAGQFLQTNGSGDTSWATAGGSGETNTASNVGGGNEVFKQKTGVNLEFRTLIAGSGITLTQNASDITIDSSGGSGAATNLNNLVATSINQNLRPNSALRTIGESGGFSWGRAYVNSIYDNANNIAFDTLGRTIYDGIYGASVIFGDASIFIQPSSGSDSRSIKWQPPLGIGSLSLKSPNNMGANVTLTLPNSAGTSGQSIISNGSGVMSWSNRTVIESGATGSRPASPVTGETYFDTTLGKPIWWSGSQWVDATGTGV
jgi:hypothetical protein